MLYLYQEKNIVSTTHIEDQLDAFLEKEADTIILYRHQNSKIKHLMLGNAVKLEDGVSDKILNATGFVMHPFVEGKYSSFFVNQVFSDEFSNELCPESILKINSFYKDTILDETDTEIDFNTYARHFSQMHSAICDNRLEKVILSRIKKAEALQPDSIVTLFEELCSLYPHAFIYVVASPVSGIWIGAGPEVLLKKEDNTLYTVSLAGTLVNSPETEWSKKEIVEQALVTEYMENKLLQNGVVRYQKNGPYSAEAGQVKHLRTDFTFDQEDLNDKLSHLLSQLNPTPAVCGMPKKEAMDLIKSCEDQDRAYYAGFLGPVDKGSFTLYVNIRCMKVCKDHTALYVGGGITKESEVEKEWEETNLKAQTLLSVVKNVANLQGYE